MPFDIDASRMKGVVLLDCHEFDKVVSEFYGKAYSSCEGTRDAEANNGSLVTATKSMADEWDEDEAHFSSSVDDHFSDWLNEDFPSPHPTYIIRDLVNKGEVTDLHYEIYIWW